jgi:hypothetical protein
MIYNPIYPIKNADAIAIITGITKLFENQDAIEHSPNDTTTAGIERFEDVYAPGITNAPNAAYGTNDKNLLINLGNLSVFKKIKGKTLGKYVTIIIPIIIIKKVLLLYITFNILYLFFRIFFV